MDAILEGFRRVVAGILPFIAAMGKKLLTFIVLLALHAAHPSYADNDAPESGTGYRSPNPWAKTPKIRDGKMTLEESVLLALRNNRTITSAYLNRVTQKYGLYVAEDEFIPNFTITPSVEHSSTGPTTSSDQRLDTDTGSVDFTLSQKFKTGGTASFVWANTVTSAESDVNRTMTSSWTATLTQPLLKGAGIDVNTVTQRTARLDEDKNILSLKDTLISTVTSVITSYRSYLQTYKQRTIATDSLNRAKKLLATNQALVETGRMAGMELIQTQADIAQKEFDLISSKNNLDSSRISLIQILDIDKSTQIEPVEEKTQIKPIKPKFEPSLKIALANRPDYQQALMDLEIAKMNLLVGKNNRLWDLSLSAGASISQTDPKFKEAQRKLADVGRSDYSVGLDLTIPFGDPDRYSSYVSSKIALENQKLTLQELRENIELEIQDSIRDIELKLLQLDLARQARELSKRKLEVENTKLKAGLTTNFQIVSFQNDLVTAENNELSAEIDYLNALTNFDQTLGTTLDTWKIELADRPQSGDVILKNLDEDKFFDSD